MSTVVTFKLIVFSSANRYRSMKYSWQNRHAPFLRPSMVDACNRKMLAHVRKIAVNVRLQKQYSKLELHSGANFWSGLEVDA